MNLYITLIKQQHITTRIRLLALIFYLFKIVNKTYLIIERYRSILKHEQNS